MKALACFFTVLWPAYAQSPSMPGETYSCEKEAALGAHLAADVRRTMTVVDIPVVREYLEEVGRRIAAHLPTACPTPFTFTVVSDDTRTHEPLALPGGFLYVPTGLILAARNEGELAGMLAHAMTHIAERHGARQPATTERAGTGAVPIIYMGGWFGIREGAPTLAPKGLAESGRQMELAADRAAVRVLADAGYNPAALAAYLERTQTDVGRAEFSPMPFRDVQIGALEEAIRELPAGSYAAPDGLSPVQESVRRLTEAAPRRAPSLRKQ